MAHKFLVEILTPEKSFYCDQIESIIFPSEDGFMSIWANHETLVAAVIEGEITINTGEELLLCAVSPGFLEVRPDETIIFVQSALWPDEIDVARAEEAKRRAEERIQMQISAREYKLNKFAIARASARLSLAKKRTRGQ